MMQNLVPKLCLGTHVREALLRGQARSMTRSRYRIWEQSQPHFLTCSVVEWLPVFARPEAVQVALNSWQFLQRNQRLEIYGYVILENHLHLIASATNLSEEMQSFKSFTARQIIDLFESRAERGILDQLEFYKARHKVQSRYQLWQEGNHPQQIQGEEMMRQKLEYIHNNPVRRGYVDDPLHWRYSSARNYAGLLGLIDVVTDW